METLALEVHTYPLQLLVRKADTVLHPHLIADAAVLAEDGDALDLDAVLDDAGRVAANGSERTLNTSPGTDTAAPADDRVQHAGVVLDLRVFEDDTLLDTGASTDDDAGPDAHVGTELGGGVNLGGGVDEDRGDHVGAGLGQLVTAGLPGTLEVERVGRDSRASGFDLTPEVLGLVNEKLLAVGHVAEDVLFEADDLVPLALVVLVVIGEDVAVFEVIGGRVRDEAGRAVHAALDGGLDGGEDGVGGEEVYAAVDEVADARLGLLDVVQDSLSVGIGHDAAEVGGSIVADAGAENNSLGVFLHSQLQHLGEGEGAANVGVEDEEALGAALEDGIAEVVETASGAEGLVLAQVLDGDGGELLGRVFDEVAEDGLVVVADDADLLDLLAWDAGNGGEAMPDDGVSGDFEEGFGNVEGEGSEAGAARRATNLETQSIREVPIESGGRRRLTRITAFVAPTDSFDRCGTWRDIVVGVAGGYRGAEAVPMLKSG